MDERVPTSDRDCTTERKGRLVRLFWFSRLSPYEQDTLLAPHFHNTFRSDAAKRAYVQSLDGILREEWAYFLLETAQCTPVLSSGA